MIRYSIVVSGRVQGVGFRFFAQQQAEQYGLTGWVKNLYDGRVAMEVQGDTRDIQLFMGKLYEGNRFICVNRVEKNEISIDESEAGFRVSY